MSAGWYKHRFSDEGDFLYTESITNDQMLNDENTFNLDLDGSEDGSSSVDDNDSSNSESNVITNKYFCWFNRGC